MFDADDDDDDDDSDKGLNNMSAICGRLRRVDASSPAAVAKTPPVPSESPSSASSYELQSDAPFVIGRQQGSDVRLNGAAVSRRHAVFQMVDGEMVLKNMSKLNPVSLNDAILDVETAVRLKDGDRIGIHLTSEDVATFVYERAVAELVESVMRSPLKENVNGGNTPPMSPSPVKGAAALGNENKAPTPKKNATPRRSSLLSKLLGTPTPKKRSETASPAKTKSPVGTPTDKTMMGEDFPNGALDEEDAQHGTPVGQALATPKSPAKSALKAPENRLACRPSTIRRRSISFAGAEELEAIKWIAPHNGKVELCGRIAPIDLNKPRSPRARRSPSRSPKSAGKKPLALPAPAPPPLALPAPPIEDGEKVSSGGKKRRSSISFKAVEDGDEQETPDSAFTRSGSRMKRNDTPRVSTRRRSMSSSAASPKDSTPMATDDDIDQTESVPALTPQGRLDNIVCHMNFAATPSSEFKRPPAPHNTPVAPDFSAASPAALNLDGWNLFRSTPGAAPRELEGIFAEDKTSDDILRVVELLEAEAEEDVAAASELDGALTKVATPLSAKKRVDQWLSDDQALAALPDAEMETDKVDSDASHGPSPSPAKSIIVKCKSRKRRNGKKTGVSLRMEQLHKALKLSRRALLKERKRSDALKEMYLDLLNSKQEELESVQPKTPKTPKVAMTLNVKDATPKTPKVAMNVNVKEATPKIVMRLNIRASETPKASKIEEHAQEKEQVVEEEEEEKVVKHDPNACATCQVVDKCKTVRCTSCKNVFHLKCLKPKLTRTPKGRWTCASCVPSRGDEKTETKSPAKKRALEESEETKRPTRATRRTRQS